MDCEANTFFGVMNAFRGLNVFSLLPLSRQEYMLMFLVFRHRKTNPEGCTVSTLTRLMRVPQPAVSRTLRGLENNGYIRREVCREERRWPGPQRSQHVCDTDGCRRDRGTACQSAFGGISPGYPETIHAGRVRSADGTAAAALYGGIGRTG